MMVRTSRARRSAVVIATMVVVAAVVALAAVVISTSVGDDVVGPGPGESLSSPPSTSTGPSSAGPSSAGPSTSAGPPTDAPGPDITGALRVLDTLPVKGRAPKTGYARSNFGQAWDDDVDVEYGHNGCRTREDILRRDLVDITLRSDCRVLSGTLHDPYTGTSTSFVRGQETSALVQIDHVVALSDAWQKGAQQLSPERRRDFANDPRNLQAVHGWVNQRKGAGDAATWLPPNRAYRCTYVARQIEVKALYDLWVTQAEKDAMQRVLAACDR